MSKMLIGERGNSSPGQRLLFVVSRDQLELYQQLSRGFDGSADVETILDRRAGAAPAAAPAEDRRAADHGEQLELQGWFMAWRATPGIPDLGSDPADFAAPAPAEAADALDDPRQISLDDALPPAHDAPVEDPLLERVEASLALDEATASPDPPAAEPLVPEPHQLTLDDALGHPAPPRLAAPESPALDRPAAAPIAPLLAEFPAEPIGAPSFRRSETYAPPDEVEDAPIPRLMSESPQRPHWVRPALIALAGLCALGGVYAVAKVWTGRSQPSVSSAPAPTPSATAPAAEKPPAPAPGAPERAAQPAPPAADAGARQAEARKELRAALAGWTESIARGRLEGHMEWYADRLAVFYGGKNVPKSAVLAVRRKTFADATRIEARVTDPEIRLTPDDLGATMVFKETYRFTGPRINRRGTALQELTWRKTGDGWRIVGERTLRDLPPETARPKRS